MTQLGNTIDIVEAIVAGDESRVTGDWRQFDILLEGSPCPARVIVTVEGRDLIEYALMDEGRLVHTGLRWDDHVQRSPDRPWHVSGGDVDYDRLTVTMLRQLAAAQVQWIGRPEGYDHPVPRPKLQLDDRACVHQLASAGSAPVRADHDTVRPFVLSDRGAATVLTAWTGEPVVVHWPGKSRRRWCGVMEQVGSPGSRRFGLQVQSVSDDSDQAPRPGDHVSFDVGDVSQVYNRTRDSNLKNLPGMWDYRPTLGFTTRKVPFTADVNIPFTQGNIDALVERVRAGEVVQESTEEIITRSLDGGFTGDCELGSSHYWVLRAHEEDVEEDSESDEVADEDLEWEQEWDDGDKDEPFFLYELSHSEGGSVYIAVMTSTWHSFDGGPSWYAYDERIYHDKDEIRRAYSEGYSIEEVQ